MAHPDPQIRRGGGGGVGGGQPDPQIRGVGSPKKFFGPTGPQFGLKIRGGGLPLIRHCCNLFTPGKPLGARSPYVPDRVTI